MDNIVVDHIDMLRNIVGFLSLLPSSSTTTTTTTTPDNNNNDNNNNDSDLNKDILSFMSVNKEIRSIILIRFQILQGKKNRMIINLDEKKSFFLQHIRSPQSWLVDMRQQIKILDWRRNPRQPYSFKPTPYIQELWTTVLLQEEPDALQSLTTLIINWMGLGDEGMGKFSEFLREEPEALQSLTTLSLQTNLIGDEGMRHFSEALREQPESLPSLTELDLSNNQIGAEGIRYLLAVLEEEQPEGLIILPSLTTLNLDENLIEEDIYARQIEDLLQARRT